MRVAYRWWVAGWLFFWGSHWGFAQLPVIEDVHQVAHRWVHLLDENQFSASWDEAAAIFRGTVGREDWVVKVAADRKKLGAISSRQLVSAEKVQPSGMPPGEYAKVIFQTGFTQAGVLQEVISLQKETDQPWRVVGYVVR